MMSVKEKLEARKVSGIDTVKTYLAIDYFENLSGLRPQCVKLLVLNGVQTFQFVTGIKDFLVHVRCKNRNLIITEPVNCAETFMLKPFKLIFSDRIPC